MINNGTTTMTTSTSTVDNNKKYHHHAGKKLQLQRPQRKISLRRLTMYLVGVMTLSVPYFLISFSSISSSYQQESSSNIDNDCNDNDNNNANAFASILAGSKVSSSSSSSSSSSLSLSVHRHDQQQKQKHQILPPVYSLEHPPNHSPYKILHTVMTRFMVGQSNAKYELARARYLLFESFCWPTIQYQTSKNFFWLVLVDPGLDISIINDMQSLLNAVPTGNAYMILTNNTAWSADGVGVENVTSYGVGLQIIVEEYTNGKLDIITGNTTYLLRALNWMTKQQLVEEPQHNNSSSISSSSSKDNNIETSKPIMVIETLLDADDGINNHGVEWIQDVAIQRTKEHQQQQQQSPSHPYPLHPTLNSTWWFLCGTDHIEWHNRDIFKLTNEEYTEHGITSGLAGLRQSPYFCTSAGFTRIGITTTTTTSTPMTSNSSLSSSSSSPFKFPKDAYSNHALAFYFPECTSTNTTTATSTIINNNGNYSHCWRREFSGEAFILKSRTITSDSMDHMNPRKTDDYRDVAWLNKTDYPLLINETERMWNVLTKEFAIDRLNAWETSTYIFDNRRLILRQNKDSRCSPGFPCYKEAKKNLIRMEKYWLSQTKQAIIDKKKTMDRLHQLAEERKKIDYLIGKMNSKKNVTSQTNNT
jgi:hypothetical protein